jgi:hypothetical protein
MKAFIDWFSADQDLDPVRRAGVAHLLFVTIHPFDDGAHAIVDMQLARSQESSQALLQHVQIRQDHSAYDERPRRRAISTSPHGRRGFWIVSTSHSIVPKRSSHRCSARRASGSSMPARLSTTISA